MTGSDDPRSSNDDGPIEGELVSADVRFTNADYGPAQVGRPFNVDRHRGTLTILLIALLAALIFGELTIIVVMEWNSKPTDSVKEMFHESLPVLAGLATGAAAFYFSDRRLRRS